MQGMWMAAPGPPAPSSDHSAGASTGTSAFQRSSQCAAHSGAWAGSPPPLPLASARLSTLALPFRRVLVSTAHFLGGAQGEEPLGSGGSRGEQGPAPSCPLSHDRQDSNCGSGFTNKDVKWATAQQKWNLGERRVEVYVAAPENEDTSVHVPVPTPAAPGAASSTSCTPLLPPPEKGDWLAPPWGLGGQAESHMEKTLRLRTTQPGRGPARALGTVGATA
ncbi:hypothetical protein TREES_T100001803 [Tupaia chinensis]|uniref:Uncharacterized protein n=1 Tax=Tupaia chinensis TaxID=246437 RepID=L9KKV1_TUPCH|nr:hypothetical protein TREES_T100001803 [Tupaia chinensis]